MKLKAIIVPALAVASTVSISPAHASTPSASIPAGVTQQGRAYLNSLSPAQRSDFIKKNLVASMEYVETTRQVNSIQVADSSGQARTYAAAAVSGQKCYMHTATNYAKGFLGNKLFSYYETGAYCSAGGRITKNGVYQAGGSPNAPGWTYKGVIHTYQGILYNQGRSAAQMKFEFGASVWTVQQSTPCAQVDGNANGSGTVRWTCNLG